MLRKPVLIKPSACTSRCETECCKLSMGPKKTGACRSMTFPITMVSATPLLNPVMFWPLADWPNERTCSTDRRSVRVVAVERDPFAGPASIDNEPGFPTVDRSQHRKRVRFGSIQLDHAVAIASEGVE